jgi:protein-S-isoprenylcysteine O-methyltransferase Ste14
MDHPRSRIRANALRFGLLELLIVLVGILYVRKELYMSHQFKFMLLSWQQYVLLLLMFADGVLRAEPETADKANCASPFRTRFLAYFWPVTVFLFVACASLCDRINVACIRDEWWRDSGLALVGAAVLLLGWQQRTCPAEFRSGPAAAPPPESAAVPPPESAAAPPGLNVEGPWKWLRYPDRSSILLELAGITMVLCSWLPLWTLPGLAIVFKWELEDLERLRISQFGEKYMTYKKKTWFLIPFIW